MPMFSLLIFVLFYLISFSSLFYSFFSLSLFPSRTSFKSIFDLPVLLFFLFSGISLILEAFLYRFYSHTSILWRYVACCFIACKNIISFLYFRLFFILVSFYESIHLLLLRSHPSFFTVYFSTRY